MTSFARLNAAATGQAFERKATLAWKVADPADAVVGMNFVEILNPFGLALQKKIDLNAELSRDPVAGGELLDRLVVETEVAIRNAFKGGAEGILYVLLGAAPSQCTPMQYGGYYLERDREILEGVQGLVALFVAGEDAYLDFVSDLPAGFFGWSVGADSSVDDVKKIRVGALLAADPEADLVLIAPHHLSALLEPTHSYAAVE